MAETGAAPLFLSPAGAVFALRDRRRGQGGLSRGRNVKFFQKNFVNQPKNTCNTRQRVIYYSMAANGLYEHPFDTKPAICVDAGGCRASCAHRKMRVFPRSMSDLRTGRKNYGCEGICTALHSAARTNVRDALRGFFPGELPSGSPDFLMQTGRTPGSVCDLSARLRQNKFRRRMEWQSKKKSEFG